MKLIVGLGNPGNEYCGTRHNVGFELLDSMALRMGVSFDKKRFNALYTEVYVKGEKIFLVKPLSYMNLSGGVVSQFLNFYKIGLDDLLVIQDDLDMDFGRIKVVFNSSSGGHNGIKDIEKCVGSKAYARLKIGISNNKMVDTKDYVLGKFSGDEREKLKDVYDFLGDIVSDFCSFSLDRLMNKYNRK